MTRSRPSDVETLACAAAGEYAGRWARGVARLQAGAAPWLVDGFAGADLQRAALRGAVVPPPALAFARAAEQALGGEARIVLAEEDPGLLARLEDELRGAGADRLRRTSDPSSVEPGEIALVEAPLASVVDRLAEAIGGAPALVRLAPLAARALPWIVLEPLAMMLPAANLLIRVPQEDFTRVGRFSGPLADFPPHLRRVAESCSAMFADPRHGWLLAWREAMRAGGEEAALAGAVERLRTMLGDADEGRTVRAARLEAGGAAVQLILSTPHAEHAVELDDAIADAGATPAAAAPALKRASKSAAKKSAAPAAPTVDAPAPAPESAESAAAGAAGAAVRTEPDASTDIGLRPTEPPLPRPLSPAERKKGENVAGASTEEPATPPVIQPAPEPVTAETPVLDLFALPAAPEPAPRGPDLRAVADDLHARHAGETVPFRELLAGLADAGLAPEQVRSALSILKRSGRASYRSLDAEGAEVDFPAEAPAPPPPPAPKPRKARKPAPDLLGLFDEPEPGDEP